MAGSQTLRVRGARFSAALAVSFLTFAGGAHAQKPSQPLPPVGTPIASLDEFVESVTTTAVVPAPMAVPAGATYYPGPGVAPTAPRVVMSPFGTIIESLFGDASAEGKWRPLTLGTFLTEGWNEPWAGGPAGQSGLTPRHGWLGSFEGVFYRLGLVNMTYQNNLNKPYGGNGYRGDYSVFLPLSRRLELFLNVPFVVANGTQDTKRGYRSDFGDMSIAASFLLSESKAFTQLFTLGTIVPTGQTETGGNLMTVFPRYSFWSNPGGSWVIRGGTGVNVPLNKNQLRTTENTPDGGTVFGDSTAQTTFNGDLAIGRYFTPHDVLFGDLVFYANCNFIVPLEDGGKPTYVGVGPGTRFQIAGNWYLLHYWEFPVVGPQAFDYQMQTAILKAW